MRTGTADLPLHNGRAPRWLTARMERLARCIVEMMVVEFGTRHVLARLADPYWFQSFGCLLGFDWHSSGLTTTVCAALKVALTPAARDLGIHVCGGKGRHSRSTPQEIESACESIGRNPEALVRASRLSAKIDNAALQDGFQLYHHSFFFNDEGDWSVVQQGMADEKDPLGAPNRGYARRYHWFSGAMATWLSRPESAICCERRAPLVIDMVAPQAEEMRRTAALIVKEHSASETALLIERLPHLVMARRHDIVMRDINPHNINRILLKTYRDPPENFLALLAMPGIGPRTLRALALVSEIVYGAPPSWHDPARFSFAHGGKDGTPFPVDRATYDHTIDSLREILSRARGISHSEKRHAFSRLRRLADIHE